MTDRIISWSFSRWDCYQECPRKAKYKFIDKLQEPKTPALERGIMLHELAESYLRGLTRVVPKDLRLITFQLKDLKKREAIPEAEHAFDKNWQPVDWFSKEAWCRVKADATILPSAKNPVIETHDFKSGKSRIENRVKYDLQLELYSLGGLIKHPASSKAISSLIFIDTGESVQHLNPSEYLQKDVKALKKDWETRVKRMLNDTRFAPNPGNACRWCHFRKSNGGPCEF